MRPLGPPCMAPARLGHALRGRHSRFPGGSSAQQRPAGKAMLGGMGDSQALGFRGRELQRYALRLRGSPSAPRLRL